MNFHMLLRKYHQIILKIHFRHSSLKKEYVINVMGNYHSMSIVQICMELLLRDNMAGL